MQFHAASQRERKRKKEAKKCEKRILFHGKRERELERERKKEKERKSRERERKKKEKEEKCELFSSKKIKIFFPFDSVKQQVNSLSEKPSSEP